MSSQQVINQNPPLYLIDASIYIFRSWFSMPDSIVDQKGNSVNAVYGYLLFISKFLKSIHSSVPNSASNSYAIAFTFDESLGSCFRNTLYPLYKSSRGLPDDDLAHQLKLCRKLTESLGFACFSSKRYEADDLIGSLAQQYSCLTKQKGSCVILSRDKDLGQLLGKRDKLWDFAGGVSMDKHDFQAKFQVSTEQFADYLALVGDPVDDIPGVKGLGAKAAAALLTFYPDIEAIYESIDTLVGDCTANLRGAKRIQNLLVESENEARLSKKLATIHCDINVLDDLDRLLWKGVKQQRFKAALTRYLIAGRSRKALINAFEEHYTEHYEKQNA